MVAKGFRTAVLLTALLAIFVNLMLPHQFACEIHHNGYTFAGKAWSSSYERNPFLTNKNIEKPLAGESFSPFTEANEALLSRIDVRAFPPWPENLILPCGKADPLTWSTPKVLRSPAKEGILFVKENKCGSSTVSGVAIRIARNIAKRKNQEEMCVSRFLHSPARKMEYVDRDRQKSFLFSVIRNPQKRITSQFFHFQVSRNKVEPSDGNFNGFIMKSTNMHDYHLKDLSLIPPHDKELMSAVATYKPLEMDARQLRELRVQLANDIMRGYDFIGIMERLDESLVAIMMILRLKVSDLLYLKAKSSGSFDDGAFQNTCFYIVPSFTSPGMKAFFESQEYLNISAGDWMLYRAVEKSLDLTIDGLGRKQFNRHLSQFQAAQELVNVKCGATTRYPCSESGQLAPVDNQSLPITDCLFMDSGCGYECMDKLADEIETMIEQIG